MKNILIICQARYGSTRLRGKVLLKILGKPLLWYLVKRLEQVKIPNKILIATASTNENKPILEFAEKMNLLSFPGSEDDVLDRYYQAAKKYGGDIIVRITGDCPLSDPTIIDRALEIFLKGNYDYVSNVEPPTYPDGFDVEVFSFETLERIWKDVEEKKIREHVTFYIRLDIRNNQGKFRTYNFENDKDYHDYRLTVDNKEDFDLISLIIKEFRDNWSTFTLNEVIEFIDKNPKLRELNKNYDRDEAVKNITN